MNKKVLIGLVAVVALAGAAFYFSGMGGGLFKGMLTVKPVSTSTTLKPVVTESLPSPSTSAACKDLSTKFSAIQIEFVKESALTSPSFPKLNGYVSGYNALMNSSAQDIKACNAGAFVTGLRDSMNLKLANMLAQFFMLPNVTYPVRVSQQVSPFDSKVMIAEYRVSYDILSKTGFSTLPSGMKLYWFYRHGNGGGWNSAKDSGFDEAAINDRCSLSVSQQSSKCLTPIALNGVFTFKVDFPVDVFSTTSSWDRFTGVFVITDSNGKYLAEPKYGVFVTQLQLK